MKNKKKNLKYFLKHNLVTTLSKLKSVHRKLLYNKQTKIVFGKFLIPIVYLQQFIFAAEQHKY